LSNSCPGSLSPVGWLLVSLARLRLKSAGVVTGKDVLVAGLKLLRLVLKPSLKTVGLPRRSTPVMPLNPSMWSNARFSSISTKI
jgi:hypothetical protein